MDKIINDTSDIEEAIKKENDPSKRAILEYEYKKIKNNDDAKKIKSNDDTQNKIWKVIKQNITKKDGKYIVFLPENPKKSSGKSTEEYVKEQIEIVKEHLKDIDDAPEISYLLSERKGGKGENNKAINQFEGSNSKHIKLLFAIDKLNEGVHVEGVNGEMMLRKIGPGNRILYLQQLGRVIYSIDPENPPKDEDLPIVYDVYNNWLTQNMDKEITRSNSTSDLHRLERIVSWINKHGYFPDINNEEDSEANKAIFLKKIKLKYEKYINGENLDGKNRVEILEINKIIKLANSIGLFNIEIPPQIKREDKEGKKDSSLFEVKGSQLKFRELFKEVTKIEEKENKLSPEMRLKMCLNLLETLADYNIDINNETITEGMTLKDFLENIPGEIRKEVIDKVDVPLEYKLFDEYNYSKISFLTCKEDDNIEKMFTDLDVEKLKKIGIFEETVYSHKANDPVLKILETLDKKTLDELKVDINFKGVNFSEKYKINPIDNGFIIKGPKNFSKICIDTGSLYDSDGFNYDGYDSEGYDREGFNKKNWNRQHINKRTGTKYNHLNLNEEGYDPEGYNFQGWNKEHINKETGTKYNKWGYNEEGYDKEGYNSGGWNREHINKETNKIWNSDFFDEDRYYYEETEDTENRKKTSRKVNHRGFNINHLYSAFRGGGSYVDFYGIDFYGNYHSFYWHRGEKYNEEEIHRKVHERKFNKDGICIKTSRQFDEHFFNKQGINIITGDTVDLLGFNYYGSCLKNGGGAKMTQRGFYQNGICAKTGTEFDENGLNAYGINKNGMRITKDENGKIVKDFPFEIKFAKDYINVMLNNHGNIKKTLQIMYNKYIRSYKNNHGEIIKNEYRHFFSISKDRERYISDLIKEFNIQFNKAAIMYPKIREILEQKMQEAELDNNSVTMINNLTEFPEL